MRNESNAKWANSMSEKKMVYELNAVRKLSTKIIWFLAKINLEKSFFFQTNEKHFSYLSRLIKHTQRVRKKLNIVNLLPSIFFYRCLPFFDQFQLHFFLRFYLANYYHSLSVYLYAVLRRSNCAYVLSDFCSIIVNCLNFLLISWYFLSILQKPNTKNN